METTNNAISIVFTILFVASTAINIFISFKLAKFENQIRESFYTMLSAAKRELREYVAKEIDDLRDEVRREIDKQDRRYGNGK